MANQESAASQEESGGSGEDRASVSLGSAGAGEEAVRTISRSFISCQRYRVHAVLDEKVPEAREGGLGRSRERRG